MFLNSLRKTTFSTTCYMPFEACDEQGMVNAWKTPDSISDIPPNGKPFIVCRSAWPVNKGAPFLM